MLRHSQQQWLQERLAIREHLRELKEHLKISNDMESTYVHVALDRGDEIFESIKAIHGDVEKHERARATAMIVIDEGKSVGDELELEDHIGGWDINASSGEERIGMSTETG